jgi:BA14K-like protein
MSKLSNLIATAIILASWEPTSVFAQALGVPTHVGKWPIAKSGPSYSNWYYDGRDDARDFPTNGFFPGDFAANPANAAIGAAGIFGSTPLRAPNGYSSQIIVGSQRAQTHCARRYRSYDRASGIFLGNDHTRHRC